SGRAKPDRFGGLQRPGPPPNVEIAALPAERRQLTVVFVDIVGSTPLSEQIDPEEFFAVIRTYRDICNEQISQYGGHIARMIGDGLLAYFGVPQAHENDPERAVRASLAVAAAIKEHQFLLSDGSFVRLGVRIGVNTGVVVVGSVPGEPPDRREVFGSSAHVAARLQPLAPEIERLRRVTGIQEADDAELALAKLRSYLAREAPDVAHALSYYGAVLSIPACPEYEPADLGSPFVRDRALEVFIDVLIAA